MRLALVVVASLPLLLAGTRASAAGGRERIAVAVFNVSGEPIAEEQRSRLRANLRGGLASGFEVVSDAEVERAVTERGIVGCDTITCLRSLGDAVMVRRVVRANIEVIGPTSFTTKLELIDLGDGKPIANAGDNCTSCRMQEVYDGVSNAAASLKMQLEPQQGAPPPVAPAPPAHDTPPPHRGLYIGLATASGALFVASVVTLAVSAAYHGKSNCDSSLPAGERCPTRYNGVPGIVIGAIGIPLTGVATGILGWRAARSPTHVALVPTVGGGAVALDLHVGW